MFIILGKKKKNQPQDTGEPEPRVPQQHEPHNEYEASVGLTKTDPPLLHIKKSKTAEKKQLLQKHEVGWSRFSSRLTLLHGRQLTKERKLTLCAI